MGNMDLRLIPYQLAAMDLRLIPYQLAAMDLRLILDQLAARDPRLIPFRLAARVDFHSALTAVSNQRAFVSVAPPHCFSMSSASPFRLADFSLESGGACVTCT